MKTEKLLALVDVAEASFLAAQSELIALRSREDALRQQIMELRADRTHQVQSRPTSNDPALKAGVDGLWLQWIAGRQTALNAALTQIQVHKAKQFDVVKRAFGRRQAMHALAAKSQIEHRQKLHRRQAD